MSGTVRTALLPGPGDRHGPLVPLMIALTLLTGVVDAASYLRLGHVFVANMTGNVVFLGFALAGAKGLSVVSSLIALAGFLAGAAAGGRIADALASHRGRQLRRGASLQATFVAAALLTALLAGEPEPRGVRYALTVVLALAMGIQNAVTTKLAVPELTTTVLTKTLTALAWGAGDRALAARRVVSVVAMALGALGGALLALEVSVAAALALALGLACAVALAAHVASRRGGEWIRPSGGPG